MRQRFESNSASCARSSQFWICAIIGCFTLGPCLPAGAVSYDAATDFSITNGNPNGVWSYLVSGSLFTEAQAACNGLTGVACWQNGGSPPSFAGVLLNTTGSPITNATVTIPAGGFDVDPEGNSNVTILWTAPSAGTWSYSGFFSGLDSTSNAHTTYVVLDSSTTLWTIPISGQGSGSSFSGTVVLNAGDTLGFEVATGSTYTYLGTGFDATITSVPEPATFGLLGLGLAGIAVKRRSGSRSWLAKQRFRRSSR